MTTPVRCGLWLPWLLLPKADLKVGFAQQSLGSLKPEPRGAVKACERSEQPAQQVALTASTAQAPAECACEPNVGTTPSAAAASRPFRKARHAQRFDLGQVEAQDLLQQAAQSRAVLKLSDRKSVV